MGRTWGRGLRNPSCGSFCGCRQALTPCPILAQARVPSCWRRSPIRVGPWHTPCVCPAALGTCRHSQHPPAATVLPLLAHPAASPTARPAAPPLILKNAFISLFGKKGHPSLATHYTGTMEMAAAGRDPGAGIGSCGRVSGRWWGGTAGEPPQSSSRHGWGTSVCIWAFVCLFCECVCVRSVR